MFVFVADRIVEGSQDKRAEVVRRTEAVEAAGLAVEQVALQDMKADSVGLRIGRSRRVCWCRLIREVRVLGKWHRRAVVLDGVIPLLGLRRT